MRLRAIGLYAGCLLSLIVPLAAGADEVPGSVRVRSAVLAQWKLPSIKVDAIVNVKVNVQANGRLVEAQIGLDGPVALAEVQALDETKRSVEAALRRTVVSGIPVGQVEFTLRARAGARIARCYPLRVYLPGLLQDNSEQMPPTSVQALRQGLLKWNAMVVGYAGGKLPAPLILAEDPKAADVVVEVFEDYPDYSTYLVDDTSGQTILRVPAKRPIAGLLQSGWRWWHPEQVTQQIMFQLGRLLGLNLEEQPSNVLYPSQSVYYVSKLKGAGTSTKDVKSEVFGDLLDYGGGDRTVTSYQLEDAGDTIRRQNCVESGSRLPVPASNSGKSG